MADTFDDDIIDLTDLMEEGAPVAKKEPAPAKPAAAEAPKPRPPESFDLGKEISFDDEPDAVVETAGEPEPVKASDLEEISLESADDAAFMEEMLADKPAEQSAPVTPEREEPLQVEESLPVLEKKPSAPPLPEGPPVLEGFPAGDTVSPEIDLVSTKDMPEAEQGAVPTPTLAMEKQPSDLEPFASFEDTKLQAALVEPQPPVAEPGREAAAAVMQEVAAKVIHEMPAMLEDIVKPVMADLVQEILKATRELLPGIVEKVIREEIEKLKRLD